MRLIVAIAALMMVSGCAQPQQYTYQPQPKQSGIYEDCSKKAGKNQAKFTKCLKLERAKEDKRLAKRDAEYEKNRKKQEQAALEPYKQQCAQMGFKRGGEKMAACIMRLKENEQAIQQRQIEANRAYSIRQQAYESQRSDAIGGLGLAILGGGLQPRPAFAPTTNCVTEYRGGRAYTHCY